MGLKDENDVNDIVIRCVKGDRKAQHELYKMFYSKMMSVCYRYSNNSEDAKDLLQDGFMKVFLNLKNYRFTGSLEGWIRRIMVNTAIDHFKKNKAALFVDDEDSYILENSAVETADSIYNKFEIDDVMAAIQSLSPGYRAVFNLYIIEGYPHKEIAKKLNINEGTSKSNLAKAKRNLTEMLKKKELY